MENMLSRRNGWALRLLGILYKQKIWWLQAFNQVSLGYIISFKLFYYTSQTLELFYGNGLFIWNKEMKEY